MPARLPLLVSSLVAAALAGYFGAPFALPGADQRALLPGRTSRGHHLIEGRCALCHTPFRGVSNAACLRCHEAGLAAANDTHAPGQLSDPRNADRVARLDARSCVTCHAEHAPERTGEGGLTLPADFCAACHEDIGRERPSHAGFAFAGCATTGCHRFHDNRALYEGFLAEHLHEPEVRRAPRVPARVPPGPLPLAAAPDAPAAARVPEALITAWESSAHAAAGVSCRACHEAPDPATGAGAWSNHPGSTSCGRCHAGEAAGFARGPHGVRAGVGLSPLTPALARLSMRPEAHDTPLGCDACHRAHAYDTRLAAVEACLGCHADRHSLGWRASRHAGLWQREIGGTAPPGSGVSCATCHLPRELFSRARGAGALHAQHDQGDNLRPRDKMLRSVCLSCHGLGFAVDALADAELVARNFNGRPAVHVGSLELVEKRLREGGTIQ